MREVRMYDPARWPPHWTEMMSSGQYAVVHCDAATGLTVDSRGDLAPDSLATCFIFDRLRDAENYCQQKIEAFPSLICEIYDREGKAKPPLETFASRARQHAERSIWRSRVLWGNILTAFAVLGLWIDWRSDWVRMWPTILGLKCLTVAIILYAWDIAQRLSRAHG
jgi:hypothetical protein